MMFFFIFFFLNYFQAFSAESSGNSSEEIKFEAYLDELLEDDSELEAAQQCSSPPLVAPLLESVGKYSLCSKISLDGFCRTAVDQCKEAGLSSYCSFAIPKQASYREKDADQKILTIFDEFKKLKEKTKHQCCKDASESDCMSTYAETELIYQKDGLNQPRAHFYIGEGIKLNTARIVQFGSIASIRRFLLHELGHACAHSRVDRESSYRNRGKAHILEAFSPFGKKRSEIPATETQCVATGDEGFLGFEGVYGKDVRMCVEAYINSQEGKDNGCEILQRSESFGILFPYLFTSEYDGLSWDCHGSPSYYHPKTREILRCLFEDEDYRRKKCKSQPLGKGSMVPSI